MARNVVAFVGQDANNILRESCLGLMRELEPLGLVGHVISLADPNWSARVFELAREGILVGWGPAGIGSDLAREGRNFWEEIGVPFVSAFSDPPCWLPHIHRPGAPNVILGYLYDEYLDVQRRFIRAPQVCARLPVCVPPNALRDAIPWSRRSHRMVLIKNGESPAARLASWTRWPKRFRAALEDAAAEACRHGTMGLTDLLVDSLSAHGVFLDGRTDLLFVLMYELDLYVRAERSTRMVQALSRLPAEIIGRGWDHIDRTGARAIFSPSIDAARIPELIADTQFAINTTPNFGSGVHERVLGAFAARACAVSDHNGFSRTSFADVPSFFGVEWHADDLADRLAAIWATTTDLGPATEVAFRMAETTCSPHQFMQSILELAEVGLLAIRAANQLKT